MNNSSFFSLRMNEGLVIFGVILIALIIVLLYIFSQRISALMRFTNKKLLNDIGGMIEPKFIEFSPRAQDLLDLANEVWRINQRVTKVSESLPQNSKLGLENSMQKLYRYLERNDLEVLDYTGQLYNDNLSSVEVISVEKNKHIKVETITEMVEPAILIKGKLVKKGKVIVTAQK